MSNNVSALKNRVQRWAERITAAYGDSVQAIIEVGRQLAHAKRECTHGEWGELTGETTGKPLLPFGHATARRLKSIAANTAIANRSHGSDLPASWRTLAVLASLDPDDIESAIADGVIHPEMERKEAEALKAKLQTRRPAPAPAPVLDFPTDPPEPTEPEPSTEQQAKLAAMRQELASHIRQIGELQQAAAERRAENAWHDRNDPRTRGLALGVELVVGLGELVRMARDAPSTVVLTPDQIVRARAHIAELSAIIDEATQ